MSILEELYNGNIAPIERSIKKGSEYYKLCKAAAEKKEKLFEELSCEKKAIYESIAESKLMIESISEEEIFIYGFRLGAQIMLEIINEPDKQLLPI
ncbi:MAG: hypothetical protein UHO61_05595 [Acutalibacteraceae bacterium]|nr:hypothetical protein [Acutalibacteraceae bacterium]